MAACPFYPLLPHREGFDGFMMGFLKAMEIFQVIL